MSEVSAEELRQAVEHLHKCHAKLRDVVPVHEEFRGEVVWDGVVHVFDVDGPGACDTCYAWSSPTDQPPKRRFYAILASALVTCPLEAVRIAIAENHGRN
jgi:hypothetical protein